MVACGKTSSRYGLGRAYRQVVEHGGELLGQLDGFPVRGRVGHPYLDCVDAGREPDGDSGEQVANQPRVGDEV
jgi:hypothetical protein